MTTTTKTHSSKNNFNNVNSLSLRESLEYCIDVLKIKQDSELYGSITAEVTSQTRVSLVMIKTHGSWITAMKLIADCSRMSSYNINNNKHVFSQTQLYDFLALATSAIEGNGIENNNRIILKIARDITENYYNFSDYLKSNYPGIIVDVISILHKGVDTNGSKVNPINIEKYYQLRRQQRIITGDEVKRPLTANTIVATPIDQSEIILSLYSKKYLVESLHQITNRERNELQQSLTRLQDSDLNRIVELCQNYNRLQYYSKLITKEGSQEQFKKEIETELGRKLKSHQLGRAINSIRRAQTYVENILDNKFIPDVSHGINHVKHNIEYGYQLINLIDRTRRKHKV